MTVTGPDFIALQARDVDATAAFYETGSACAAPRTWFPYGRSGRRDAAGSCSVAVTPRSVNLPVSTRRMEAHDEKPLVSTAPGWTAEAAGPTASEGPGCRALRPFPLRSAAAETVAARSHVTHEEF